MDEPVAHPDDVGPAYVGIMFAGFLRDMGRGLADYLYGLDYCQCEHSVSGKVLRRFALGKIESVTGSVEHVS